MTRNLKEFVNQNVDIGLSLDALGDRHVAVLLAHYNGGALLAEQLQSLSAQTHRDWSLIISDDGSSDNWLSTAADFARAEAGRAVWLVNGPRQGYARNFLSLATLAGPSVPYAAFCDQDDVWLPEKLERAVAALEKVRPGQPALYCGRTTICDGNLKPVGTSPLFTRTPGFRNALVQNIGGGNTMVLNRAALDLLQDTERHAGEVASHDWWTYQLVTGCGGHVIYDPTPSILYRQHGQNQVGANLSWMARLRRLHLLLGNHFREWNRANSDALKRVKHWLNPEAQELLDSFETARTGRLSARLVALRKSGIYRQTMRGQIALWAAAVLKKL